MKKSVLYGFALFGLALLHFLGTYAIGLLTFVGSFGAPQGGDAVSLAAATRAAEVKPCLDGFIAFLEFAFAVLTWPIRWLTPQFLPVLPAWLLTSLLWAASALGLLCLARRFFAKRRSKRAE